MINYGAHSISKDDISSVIKVLKSDKLTQGSQVEKFESDLKKNLNQITHVQFPTVQPRFI